MTDAELLERYVKESSEEAFSALAARHFRMVYGVCARGLGEETAAEEACQTVFVILSRKAESIRKREALGGWLFKTAVRVVSHMRRAEKRRKKREKEAAEMRMHMEDTGKETPETVKRLLNGALMRLRRGHREAVILRYLEGKSYAELSRELGCSEDAARHRVSYGLKKLRRLLAAEGVTVPEGMLAAVLLKEGEAPVPAGLADTCVRAAMHGGGVSGTLAQGVMKMMFWQAVKRYVVAVVLAAALAGGTGLVLTAADAGEGGKYRTVRQEGLEMPVIPRVAEAPVVDGDLSDGAWKKAAVFDLGYSAVGRKGRPENFTKVKVMTDKNNNLYFGFYCKETHPDGPFQFIRLERTPEKKHFRDYRLCDRVWAQISFGRWGKYPYYLLFGTPPKPTEGFLDEKHIRWGKEPYKNYIVAYRDRKPHPPCHVVVYDSWRKRTTPGAVKIKSFKGNSKVYKGYWSVEMKVSLDELTLYPGDGIPKAMELNLFRLRWGNTRSMEDFKKIVLWDEGPAYVKGFFDHVQTLIPIHDPSRFRLERGKYNCKFVVQPLWFKLVNLESGDMEVKVVKRKDTLPPEFFKKRHWTCFGYTQEEGLKPRLEQWLDTVPERPTWESPVPCAMTPPLGVKNEDIRFTSEPRVSRHGKGYLISFAVKKPVDVTIGIINDKGKVVRHLASGVLGENPPSPLKPDSLSQSIFWDGRDDYGKESPHGKYTVRICLGLKPTFDFVFKTLPIYKRGWHKGIGVSKYAQGARKGEGNCYQPGGDERQIFVDRTNETVYFAGYIMYDGITGKFLQELKLCERLPWQRQEYSYGEVIVGPDRNLWVATYNDLRRYSMDGKKRVNFPPLKSHVIPGILRGHNNPHRGHCFGLKDNHLYIVHHYDPHGNQFGVISKFDMKGHVLQWGLIEILFPTECVKVDRDGYIYTATTIRKKDQVIPKDLKGATRDKIKSYYCNFYGSIVKFKPEGGKIYPTNDDDAAYHATFNSYASGMKFKKCKVVGGVWVHPWISPMLARTAPIKCNCESARFDLDPYERLWIPDAVRSRIEVIDKNGNTVLTFGKKGSPKDSKGTDIRWAYPMVVSVSDHAAYVGDFFSRKAVKVKLEYAAEKKTTLSLP